MLQRPGTNVNGMNLQKQSEPLFSCDFHDLSCSDQKLALGGCEHSLGQQNNFPWVQSCPCVLLGCPQCLGTRGKPALCRKSSFVSGDQTTKPKNKPSMQSSFCLSPRGTKNVRNAFSRTTEVFGQAGLPEEIVCLYKEGRQQGKSYEFRT